MTSPFFSIVIPTHNRPHLLGRALASVAAQDFTDYELIVVNDGSSLPYDEVLEKQGSQIHRLIVNEASKGASAARNAGIEAARGKWVTFLDDDDEFAAGFLGRMHARLQEAPENAKFGWASIMFQLYDEHGNPSSQDFRTYEESYPSKKELFERAITVGTGFGFTVKREYFEKIGMFDPAFRLGEDTDFILRLIATDCQAVIHPEVGVTVHCHTPVNNDQCMLNRVRWRIFQLLADRHLELFGRYPDMLVRAFGYGTWINYFCGDFAGGDRLIVSMLRAAPASPRVWKSVAKNLMARMRFLAFPRTRLGISFSK